MVFWKDNQLNPTACVLIRVHRHLKKTCRASDEDSSA